MSIREALALIALEQQCPGLVKKDIVQLAKVTIARWPIAQAAQAA